MSREPSSYSPLQPEPPVVQEGTLPVRGWRTWYRSVGSVEEDGRLPLLVLHGGPGLPSDYLEPLDTLATLPPERRVCFYDQLGCGRSDHPHDPTLWSLDLFLEELSQVRRALRLDTVHLLGHGWGGMLALEHVLRGAPGIASLVLLSTPLSMARLVAETPQVAPHLDAPHELRVALPECLARSLAAAQESSVALSALTGAQGALRDWDVTGRCAEFTTPTLVLAGRHDSVTPAHSRALHETIPWSEYLLFEQSAHMAHLEEPARFLAVVGDFLTRVEAYL